jgi:hypothetical protein
MSGSSTSLGELVLCFAQTQRQIQLQVHVLLIVADEDRWRRSQQPKKVPSVAALVCRQSASERNRHRYTYIRTGAGAGAGTHTVIATDCHSTTAAIRVCLRCVVHSLSGTALSSLSAGVCALLTRTDNTPLISAVKGAAALRTGVSLALW